MATAETARRAWTCRSCATVVSTPYCPECGERPVVAGDLTLRGLLRQLVNAASSVDGRVLRSLRELLVRPGALTVSWIEGPRKPYVGPIQLFLLANVVFVAVQSFTASNVFSSTLDSHLHHQDWSSLAARMVADHVKARSTTIEAYAPVFDHAVAIYAKAFVIVMTIPFAAFLPIVFFRMRRPFFVHVVFSLHVYAFILLLYCMALAIVGVDVLCGGAGLASPRVDHTLTALNLAACAIYLYLAIGRVYGGGSAWRAVTSAALAVAILAIVLGYRFGLFVLTLRLT